MDVSKMRRKWSSKLKSLKPYGSKIRRKWSSKLKSVRPYLQLLIFILLSFAAVLTGFKLKPAAVHIPAISYRAAPGVMVSANGKGLRIYHITSEIADYRRLGQFGGYDMTGTIKVPPGKYGASVFLDIYGWKTVRDAYYRSWKIIHHYGSNRTRIYELQRSFAPGVSQFSLSIGVNVCNCAAYGSPYWVVTAANVFSSNGYAASGPEQPPGAPVLGGPYPVALSFRQSKVDLEYSKVPSDLSIVTANPETPIYIAAMNDWSWPKAAYGSFTAIDLGASANRDNNLFWAGLALGIAGSAIIAAFQAGFAIKKSLTASGPETEASRPETEEIAVDLNQSGEPDR
jgi:hypothetical protein